MPEEITLTQYRELTKDLPYVHPLGECGGNVLIEPLHVEPLENRNLLEVERTCILKCETCGKEYVCRWD